MIPFPFAYYQPKTLSEAADAYQECLNRQEKPQYYSGGTEIITMGRTGSLRFDAVIDLKGIPEMHGLKRDGNHLSIGAAETLNDIARWNAFPLLTQCCARVADHTAQCKITLGGNIAGTIIYHEAVLPLLLANASVELFGPDGARSAELSALFSHGLHLMQGEILVRFSMDANKAGFPFAHAKHVDSEKIGYPLFTLAAVREKDMVRAAVSGLYPFPIVFAFLPGAESLKEIRDQLHSQLCGEPISDVLGSGEYRLFRLNAALYDMLAALEEDIP